MSFADDYVDVAERLRQFRSAFPEGSLQPHDPSTPYRIETTADGQQWVVVVAAAYRDDEDARPGVGMAWEAYPGKTSFTRGSELQNAETSAWGRAIVAALAAETKRVASADEVRNRQAERDEPVVQRPPVWTDEQYAAAMKAMPTVDDFEKLDFLRTQAAMRGARDDLAAINARITEVVTA